MGCNAKKFQIQTAEKCGLFSSLFYGQGVYLQTVQIYHKKLPRLSGIIRVHSGRTERTSPITSERFSPQKLMQAHFPAGAAAAAAHSRPIKKLSPVSMRGNSQNGGQTTKSLLTKPQCSGVPIQQAVSLSSSFPRHCLLFVCAFFREIQAVPRSECCPAARSPAYKNHHRYSAQNSMIKFYTQKSAKIGFLMSFCRSSTNFATDLLQTTEKGASYTFHYQYAKVNSFHFLHIKKHVDTRKSRLHFQVNGLMFGGALSTALEPNTSSRVTVLASSVKLKLSTTRSSKT